jgi:hypothetical protein
MDTFNIFYSNALNTTLTVSASVTLLSAFLTLSLFVGPIKQYLHFAHVVANTRTLWNRLTEQEWAVCGAPSPKWLDILTRQVWITLTIDPIVDHTPHY